MGSCTAFVVCLVCIGSNPNEHIATDKVDLIEINHFYDEQGRLVFDQIIFYDWSPAMSRYNVRAWRLLKTPAQIPQRDWRGGEFVTVWNDGEVLRKVRSDSIRESFTQYDPELEERNFLAKEKRRELRRVSAKPVSRHP